MGGDFSNHQCFVGKANAQEVRRRLISEILSTLNNAGYEQITNEAEADRSIVVGPADRWIFIGDTDGTTGTGDTDAFEQLSLSISKLIPVVDIVMSDSAAVHFYLYYQGELVDKYGNAAFPFVKFKSEAEALPFRGKVELWTDYWLETKQAAILRSVWVQKWGADKILADTAKLFGWHPHLCQVGYTYDDEGLPIKYNDYLSFLGETDFTSFDEFHFHLMRVSG
jgi:hypothetical protein